MIIGAIPLSLTVGLTFYVVTRSSLGFYQRSRREKLAKRREAEESDIAAGQTE